MEGYTRIALVAPGETRRITSLSASTIHGESADLPGGPGRSPAQVSHRSGRARWGIRLVGSRVCCARHEPIPDDVAREWIAFQ